MKLIDKLENKIIRVYDNDVFFVHYKALCQTALVFYDEKAELNLRGIIIPDASVKGIRAQFPEKYYCIENVEADVDDQIYFLADGKDIRRDSCFVYADKETCRVLFKRGAWINTEEELPEDLGLIFPKIVDERTPFC